RGERESQCHRDQRGDELHGEIPSGKVRFGLDRRTVCPNGCAPASRDALRMSAGVEILPAVARDHAERAALWSEALSDYYVSGSQTAESLAGFERAFDLDLDGSRLVVEGGRPVAFAMLGVRGKRAWVGGMGVVPAARRGGHGRRVMEAIIECAR